MHQKEQLAKDIAEIAVKAYALNYRLTPQDIFALGYIAGKYNLEKLINNQDAVTEACRKYDEEDDLKLLDTVGEVLIDLDIIHNDDGIL